LSGAKATPYGWEAYGSAIVCTTLPVSAARTLTVALPWLTTQIVPSGARPSVLGFTPTGFSSTLAWVPVSMAATVSVSGFTTHMRLRPASSAIGPAAAGLSAVRGLWITWVKELLASPAVLRAVTVAA
jgi:hypothetical protein